MKRRTWVRAIEGSGFEHVKNLSTLQNGGRRIIEMKDADIWTRREAYGCETG